MSKTKTPRNGKANGIWIVETQHVDGSWIPYPSYSKEEIEPKIKELIDGCGGKYFRAKRYIPAPKHTPKPKKK